MGFSLCWLAVKGKSPQAVREELGFRPTGEREEIPEAELSAVEMPNGWYLIVSNHTETVATDAVLQRLSGSGGEAVTCFVEEHVMASHASGWKDGRKLWSVTHDNAKGRGNLEIEGEPPPAFESIRNGLQEKQRVADAARERVDFIFDVPVDLAQALAGYRHDQDVPGLSGDVFEVMEGAVPAGMPQKKPFWKKLFGT